MKTPPCIYENETGFTLIEIILTIIVGGILAALVVQFMGTSMVRSTEPVTMVQEAFSLSGIMEKITADYKDLLETDPTPLATLKTSVGGEGTSQDNKYGKYWVDHNHYITFDGSGNEVAGGNNILKVTITKANQTLTALFT